MKEVELNTIFNIVVEPVQNVVNIKDNKVKAEVERIVRIFKINEEQRELQNAISLSNLGAFDFVQSYN